MECGGGTMAYRIVDLTLTLRHGMRGVQIEPSASIEQEGLSHTNLCLTTHAGTHLDAPFHFVAGGRTVDKLDLAKCMGPALVVDLSHKAEGSLITPDDLIPSADQIFPGSRLLLRTDWDKHADRSDYRIGFPRLSLDLAEWLVERGIWLLGVETPSVASLRDRQELQRVHQTLLAGEIVIVESLANLRNLQEKKFFFIALPLKIEGRDGSPVRAVAIEGMIV
jgi:kynurenine formamidase